MTSETPENPPEFVKLVCRQCGAQTMIEREEHEPASVATITCLCFDCDSGGFDNLEYLDVDGNSLGDIFEHSSDHD